MQHLLVAPGLPVRLFTARFHGADSCQVAGEIATYRTLRIGFIVAVFIVGILYIIVNVVFVGSHPGATVLRNTFANICGKLTALPYTTDNIQYAAKVGSISVTMWKICDARFILQI